MIHFLKTIKSNSDRDVKVDYGVIFYEVQTRNFLHIPVKSIVKPQHVCVCLNESKSS